MAKRVPKSLVAAFRRLGVKDAEMWARSEANGGINQLARAKLLYWLFDCVTRTDNASDRWVDVAIEHFDDYEAYKRGRGTVDFPQAPIYKRMLKKGFTRKDIRIIRREAEIRMLEWVCSILDGSGHPPTEVAPSSFGVFELDAEGRPLQRVHALHENLYDFDREYRQRRKPHRRLASSAKSV